MKKGKPTSSFSKFVLIGILGLLTLSFVTFPVQGQTIVASNASNNCQANGATSFTCTLSVTTGHILVLFAGWLHAAAGGSIPTFTPADSQSNSFTFVTSIGLSGTCGSGHDFCQTWVYTVASAASTGTDTFTFTYGANGILSGNVYDISGASLSGLQSGVGTSVPNSASSTFAVTPFPAGALSIAGYATDGATQPYSAGTGFTLITNQPQPASAGSWFAGESGDTGTGNTTCPMSLGSPAVAAWTGACITFSPGGGGPGNNTIGSCPTKDTATVTLANSTQYFYTATTLQNMIINNFTAEVASVNSGHVASETLYFGIYSTTNAGIISAGNPLLLAGFKTWTLSATSAPQKLLWSIGLALNVPQGATWAISISGNSKILINQSGLTGLQTGASGPVVGTTGTLAGQFTSLSASASTLYMCASSSFQSVVTTTVTSTIGSATTTFTNFTSTVTVTTTATTIDQNVLATTTSGATVLMLVILIPALALGMVGALAKSAPIAGAGFVGGLSIGAGIGNYAGIVPFWLLGVIVIATVLIILFLVMAMRGGGGGS